jgi:type IV pilus assembly protein PilO
MKRQTLALAIIGAILLVVVSFLFLIKPKMDTVAELEQDAVDLRAQQQQVRTEIARLEGIRSQAPEIEAQLAAAQAVVPTDAALPSALRQMQRAADESGVILTSVAPGRPQAVQGATIPELASITMNMAIDGGYFQLVDFLRRIEDPAITARGVMIGSVTASTSEYPTLSITVGGQMYALLTSVPSSRPEPAETPTDGETDVEADLEVETEEVAG